MNVRMATCRGETTQTCPGCVVLRAELDGAIEQLQGAERDIRGWRTRCANLERDREAEAKASELWEPAQELFLLWREKCNHRNSRWTADRFYQVEPLLRRYGAEACERAIAGAAYDAFTKPRRNGTTRRFDGWDLIFRSASTLEEFACRAPKGWKPNTKEQR